MPGMGTATANSLLQLLFNGTTFTGVAQNASSPLTSFYISLHTADPGLGGSQNTNEISYTSYSRVAVSRTAAALPVTSNSVSSANPIVFPTSTGGTGGTVTNWSIGTASSGAGQILYTGTVSPNIPVSNGTQPELPSDTIAQT